MPVALTPEEWEWFKRLSRKASPAHEAPADITRKLVQLELLRLTRRGVLRPTPHGRDVLRLVGTR
jgi:hypothetical protein